LAAQVAVQVALLPAEALGLAHHAGIHAQLGQHAQDRLGAERFDDDTELLHRPPPSYTRSATVSPERCHGCVSRERHDTAARRRLSHTAETAVAPQNRTPSPGW